MKVQNVAGSIGALALAGIVAGCASPNGQSVSQAQPSAASAPTTAPATPAAAPSPDPSPNGTFEGSCDYTLPNDMYGTYYLVGEIDVKNTGNVGVKVRTRITWPQEGAVPITARKVVRVPFGADKVVRFKVPVSTDVLSSVQSWQERHGMKDGCTYFAAFNRTFGAVHS